MAQVEYAPMGDQEFIVMVDGNAAGVGRTGGGTTVLGRIMWETEYRTFATREAFGEVAATAWTAYASAVAERRAACRVEADRASYRRVSGDDDCPTLEVTEHPYRRHVLVSRFLNGQWEAVGWTLPGEPPARRIHSLLSGSREEAVAVLFSMLAESDRRF